MFFYRRNLKGGDSFLIVQEKNFAEGRLALIAILGTLPGAEFDGPTYGPFNSHEQAENFELACAGAKE